LAIAHRIPTGVWVWPHQADGAWTLPILLAAYLGAFALGGAYRVSPRRMHLPEFMRMAGSLVAAWVLSVALTYAVRPNDLMPRAVMAVHGLASMVGLVGLRAVLRQLLERFWPVSPAPPSPPPEPLRLHDLIDRGPAQVDAPALRNHFAGRTVLVTGAGGSIGSELCEQLLALQPFRLVCVDVSEYNLYRLERTIRALPFEGEVEVCIGDVRDASMIDGLFERLQPDVVLHTAAYKHVPLMERHPAEAFRNNTLATVHLLRLCEQHDVGQFVFVSTDKAVEPTSVLGATKRLAEWYVRANASDVACTIVRFGNVFGSQGSVVPLFEEQLAAGEPLTVTHPEMERYFMSVHEACGLILQTLLYDMHPVYMLEMGDPIRIEWLARQLIRRWYPHRDPEDLLTYVGRRPGEKLNESLCMPGETPHATPHPDIVGLQGPAPHTRAELEVHFRRLDTLRRNGHTRAQIRRALFEDTREAFSPDVNLP
jgi:FlaA1/EpsC-like NDP-sugar epimerase